MFEKTHYQFDPKGVLSEASLANGAYLFRVTSCSHNRRDQILTGLGSTYSEGRYNSKGQATSYCANNVVVCLSEVLFHMYETLMDSIAVGKHFSLVQPLTEKMACLAILRVQEIDSLVKVDTEDAKSYCPRMSGTLVTFPQSSYAPFKNFSQKVRDAHKTGVVYPSARHSEDICMALFLDQTSKIWPNSKDYYTLDVTLKLVTEHLPHGQRRPVSCDPFSQKLHPTMGFYRFDDTTTLDKLKGSSVLNPLDLPQSGLIDFVRRKYVKYPADAVL